LLPIGNWARNEELFGGSLIFLYHSLMYEYLPFFLYK
jgi:hypothetical protein